MYAVRVEHTGLYLISDGEGEKFLSIPSIKEGKKRVEFLSKKYAQKEADSLTEFNITCVVEEI